MHSKTDQKFIVPSVDSLPFNTTITGQDARHISKVLRLGENHTLQVTDGKGCDYIATIISVTKTAVCIEIARQVPSQTESCLAITLCTGMLKDKKMDMIIKHSAALGIHQWIPFFCERSVPTPSEKQLILRHERWETISRESLKQCRRSRLVDISMPVRFEDVLEKSLSSDLKIAFWEKADQPLKNITGSSPLSSVFILIGPEGGFSEKEIQKCKDKGFLSCSLGPRILRAETAAISSCALIQHILGDM